MYCPKCGAEIEENSTQCSACNEIIAMNTVKETNVKKKNIPACITAGLLALSAILPFVSVSFLGTNISKSLLDGGDGIFFIIIAIISLILALKNKNVGVIVTGIIATLLAAFEIGHMNSILGDNEYSVLVQKGLGFYLLIISSIGIIITGVIGKNKNK